MSILIKNMEMPKRGETITVTICDDGLVFEEYYKGVFNAVPVPPHGRLIDADAFMKKNEYFADRDFNNPRYDITLRELVDIAPSIIPAEDK